MIETKNQPSCFKNKSKPIETAINPEKLLADSKDLLAEGAEVLNQQATAHLFAEEAKKNVIDSLVAPQPAAGSGSEGATVQP